jgi:hypothetical protein
VSRWRCPNQSYVELARLLADVGARHLDRYILMTRSCSAQKPSALEQFRPERDALPRQYTWIVRHDGEIHSQGLPGCRPEPGHKSLGIAGPERVIPVIVVVVSRRLRSVRARLEHDEILNKIARRVAELGLLFLCSLLAVSLTVLLQIPGAWRSPGGLKVTFG